MWIVAVAPQNLVLTNGHAEWPGRLDASDDGATHVRVVFASGKYFFGESHIRPEGFPRNEVLRSGRVPKWKLVKSGF